jgi:Domain of unknown function (DUF4384)
LEPETLNVARRKFWMLTVMSTSGLSLRNASFIFAGTVSIGLGGSVYAETIPPTPQRAPAAPQVELARDPGALAKVRTAKAREVLKRHCARCHGRNQLQQPLPAAGIANILDLAALARRRDLIRPGHPDASPLYLSMLTRRMPYDVLHRLKAGAEPSAGEIQTVRDWILALPETPACKQDRSATTDIANLIETDLRSLGPDLAKDRRYVSLSHMVNRCFDSGASGLAEGYRQAVAKLLNLLSRRTGPVRPRAIGEQGLVLAFDLAAIGWTREQWAWLERRYKAPVPPFITGVIRIAAGTQLPVVPADWFAHEALKPAVYDNLVRPPDHLSTLRSVLEGNIAQAATPQGAAVELSQVTGASRSILSHETPGRMPVWLAKDFTAASSQPNGEGREGGPRPSQTRLIFQLPNGFPGFALYGAQGARRASVHKSVLPEELKVANADQSGLQCLSCHAMGPSHFNGASRRTDADGASRPGGRRAVEVAFQVAGIDSGALIEGHDPVIALALRHARDLSLKEAAAELGLDPKALTLRLRGIEGDMQPVARRLLQGLISRHEFARLAAAIVPNSSLHKPDFHPEPLRLSVWSGRQGYAKNEEVRINAAATAPCRLTLVSVNAHGDAAVIFPNEFQTDNRLLPGRTIQVPDPKDGFRLRAADPGNEAIIGVCMAGERDSPPGVQHSFKLQRFTLLGNWRDHLDNALAADEAERKQVGARKPKKKRRRRRRRKAKPLPSRASKLPLPQAWAMIVIGASPDTSQTAAAEAAAAIDHSSGQKLTAQE